jgi:hypothetical protein
MPQFHVPVFTFWNVVFTAIGAAVFWGKWGKTKLKVKYLSDLLDLFPLNPKSRGALEFLIFVALGCVVGIAVVQPSNAAQALTAGFGWTGFVSGHRA